MTPLLLIICALSDHNQFMITQWSEAKLQFHVTISENNKTEHMPITRFILADDIQSLEYEVIDVDSVRNSSSSQVKNPVELGEPISIGSVRLYPIFIHPQYFRNNNNIYIKSIEIKTRIIPSSKLPELAPSLAQVFDHCIINYSAPDNLNPAGYLIIAPDAFIDELAPLARWKEKKGWHVEVRSLSQTGSTSANIKDYIANAYNSWSPRPEYVVLVGDVNYIPAASTVPALTDHPYTMITGDDFLSEVLVGRLPASSELELSTMVAKIIGYETNPSMASTTWYTRALMVGANQPGFMTTPIPTKRWVRDRLLEYGFNTVDTVFHPMPVSNITNAIDQGVIFVNYRSGEGDPDGWPWPDFRNDDIYALNNGWRLPIVTSLTCLTGNFGYGTCFGEAWLRAGNPVTPKGAIGFFGSSSPSTHSPENNCLDFGIYWAFTNENITDFGPAMYRGKMELYNNLPNDTTLMSGSSFYFHTFNLLGDPSLSVWTDIPDTFIVSHASSISVGANSFSVTVTNSTSQPVANAMVSLYKAGEVKEVQFTNTLGYVDFTFSTATQDTLFVTVSKHNYKPYQGTCIVNNSSVYVGHFDHTIDDQGGNNNGEVNPGETIQLSVTLKNYGTSTTATNVVARLSITDPLVTITDSIQSYGSINPGATASASPFVFNVSNSAMNNHILKFNLQITATQGNWTSAIWITMRAPEFSYLRNQILDGNGILEPGEMRDITVTIKNIGGLEGSNLSGILGSFCNGVVVTDSLGYFGSVAAGDSSTNSSDRFTLSAATSIAPGRQINLVLKLSGANGFADTLGFCIYVGVVDATDPLGPDDHGYYAYDDTDNDYSERPTYNWVEIDPAYGGAGDTLSLDNDETTTIPLPFSFKYYGNWYDQVSICSNGYIAMGTTWIADMYNWAIPAAGGPPLLIAPFWDDLDPTATDSSGNVCHWHDAANHRFVIEYSRLQHVHDATNPTPAELQSFEIILYDPQYYSTLTGDGEILFQYSDITNDDTWQDYATAGIENYGHTTGLQYTFANIYESAAAVLANNRAIKFTTDPPDTFLAVEELDTGTNATFWLDVSPNPFKRTASIRYMIKDTRYTTHDQKLIIYDVSGRIVKSFNLESSIMDHESSLLWDGTDDVGKRVPQGIYFMRLQGTYLSVTQKIILVD